MASASSAEDTDAVDPMIGYLLDGRYELLEVIGSGGMSIVYKAQLKNVNKQFAVKTLNIQVQTRDKVRERFHREIDLLLKLEHPHIVSVQDCLYGPNLQPYLVMDLLRGVTLEQELAKSGPLPWERVRKIMIQVCAAVKYAHQHSVVHRDLKPGNIILLENEIDFVKVLDFGLALIGENTRKITQSGEFWGSPPYASPEQVKGDSTADARSDIYSLGCVMYELLSGKDPFHGAGLYELLSKHVNEKPAPLAVTNPDVKVAPEMEQIVFKCLEKKPEDRFQTMAELQQVLENLLSNSGQIVTSFTEEPSIKERSPKNVGMFFAAAFLALILMLVFFFLKPKQEPRPDSALEPPEQSRLEKQPAGSTDWPATKSSKKPPPARKPPVPAVAVKHNSKPASRISSRQSVKPALKPSDPFLRLREHLSSGAKSE